HLLAERAGRRRDLGADEARADEEQPRAGAQCLADRLAVVERAKREHVLGVRHARQAAGRPAKREDERLELDRLAVFKRDLALRQRAARDASRQVELDALPTVLRLIVQE